jgi:hypothetical protein
MSHIKLCDHCPTKGGRSLPQHRRYFALIKAAHMHWPETHEFQPDNEDHLRKWLQCKAGHYSTTRIEVPSADPAIMTLARLAAESAVKAAGGTAWIKPVEHTLIVFTPKSIAFDKLGHKEACRLFDEVAGVLEAEIGIKADDLMREHEAAA